ncbi:hypothetical protein MNBD_ACTINO02-368 [hydrothermal vent metagenome]|uniref:Anti-sigma K factor RskA C-terminal domain-containing protein n=1 Tax=hydrothermal vent metagenome TaxID=652676 RepID=A0A3B0SV54_9ZZZZ
MNCHDIRTALLAGETSQAIYEHINGCLDCRRWEPNTVSVHKSLASQSMWAEPPAGLEDSIVAAIMHSTETADAPPAMASSTEHWWEGRRMVAILGAVAAVTILLVGIFASQRGTEPDWSVALVGTDGAPGAVATVVGFNATSGGTRVIIETDGLDSAPEGFVYQLWFSKADGDVSAGTFVDASRVELSVGINRSEFPAVWVGLQPVGSDSASDAKALLVSTADETLSDS